MPENLPARQKESLPERFRILDPEQTAEIQKVTEINFGPRGPNFNNFERIKVPSGGQLAWMVPTLDGEEPFKELTGLIIAWNEKRLYYRTAFNERGAKGGPPDCRSNNGYDGVGDPGGDCLTCPLAKFGSDPKGGRAQACKDLRALLFLREGLTFPDLIVIPPTSLKAFQSYVQRLANYQIRCYGVLTTLRLERSKNADGIDYAKVNFVAGERLSLAERDQVASFAEQMQTLLRGVTAEAEDYLQSEGHEEYSGGARGDDTPF